MERVQIGGQIHQKQKYRVGHKIKITTESKAKTTCLSLKTLPKHPPSETQDGNIAVSRGPLMGNTIFGTDGRERGGKHRKLPSFGLFLNRSSPGGSR